MDDPTRGTTQGSQKNQDVNRKGDSGKNPQRSGDPTRREGDKPGRGMEEEE